MVLIPFRGKTHYKPHPDWYLLGVQLKFPDKHPQPPFHTGVPPEELGGSFISSYTATALTCTCINVTLTCNHQNFNSLTELPFKVNDPMKT